MPSALDLPYASVDSPESIPADCAQGPASQVYQLQIAYRLGEQYYNDVLEKIAREYRMATSEWVFNHPAVVVAREARDQDREQMLTAQAEIGGRVFCVAEDNMEKVEKKVAALNKRAERTDSSPIVFTKTDEQILLHYVYHEGRGDSGHEYADFLHTYCILSGGAPKVEGFTFIATIEHTDAGNLVNRIPTEGYIWREQTQSRNLSEDKLAEEIESIDLTLYRDTAPFCEHCNKVRDRKETFIIVNHETGERKQIGRSCLRDYTGIDDPNRLVKNIEQYFEIDRFMRAKGETPTLTTINFLTHCSAVMRDRGEYVKGLGYRAIENYYAHRNQTRDRDNRPCWIEPGDSDQADARVILHWALNEWNDDSEFASNCKTALRQPSIAATTFKNRPAGLAGAVFIAKQKWNERENRRKEHEAGEVGKERGFLGQEKERITVEVTVLKRSPRETDYGTGYTLRMEDPTGNIVVWFASNLPRVKEGDYPFPVEGGRYIIKGTVKQHQDHERFGKSTILTRGSFEQTLSLPPEAQIEEQENDRRQERMYR